MARWRNLSRNPELKRRQQEQSRRYWRGESEPTPATIRRIWRVWHYYDQEQREGRLPPSIRQTCAALGYSSSSTVGHAVKMLDLWGVTKNDPGRARARIVKIAFNEWLGD